MFLRRAPGPRMAFWLSLALLALALAALVGRTPDALDALSAVQVHVGALAALLALASLVLRWRIPAAAFALAAFAALLGAEELLRAPEVPAAPGETRPLTLATANIFYGNRSLPEAVEALLGLGADVLVTHETPEALLEAPGALAARYPWRRFAGGPESQGRPVIWSTLPFLTRPTDRAGGHPDHLFATLDLGGGAGVQVAALHLDWPLVGSQAWQMEDFHRFWSAFAAPTVVAGDFNAAPWSAAVRRVERISRTRVIGGFRPTWTGGKGGRSGRLWIPFGLPIDHVLVSEGIGVSEARTAWIPGADHRAVVVGLAIPATTPADPAPAPYSDRPASAPRPSAGRPLETVTPRAETAR